MTDYKLSLYTTDDNGKQVPVEDVLWDKPYTPEEAIEMVYTIFNNKFATEITGIIINRIEEDKTLE